MLVGIRKLGKSRRPLIKEDVDPGRGQVFGDWFTCRSIFFLMADEYTLAFGRCGLAGTYFFKNFLERFLLEWICLVNSLDHDSQKPKVDEQTLECHCRKYLRRYQITNEQMHS